MPVGRSYEYESWPFKITIEPTGTPVLVLRVADLTNQGKSASIELDAEGVAWLTRSLKEVATSFSR